MNNQTPVQGISFQGKDPQETFQFYFRQHWIRMLRPFCVMVTESVLLFAIAVVLFTASSGESRVGGRLALSLIIFFFLLIQLGFLMRFYRYFLYVIVVTDRKIHRIKKTLLTVDDHESIDLWLLQDISKRQHGIIQNVLGFGTLILESQDSLMRIHFTPHASKKYQQIMHLREQAMREVAQEEGRVPQDVAARRGLAPHTTLPQTP
ncbi:MAG: hypothetical protein Q7R81_06855 [Candidatus Peregrinibacteria bacterium]|nr:hypothetical protein [Candidatus Peregrinibacteria bacterium]